MTDLCPTFRWQAGRVWNRMKKAPGIGMALSEETLTETTLYEIALEHQFSGDIDITLATKHQEAKHGADWQWWFMKGAEAIGFRVQAKRLFPDGTYRSLFKPASNPYEQLDRLVAISTAEGFKPLYCFFNYDHPAGYTHNWKAECRHGYRGPSFWGCAVADPDDVRAIGSDRLLDLAEVMYPWHQLVCRYSEGLDLLDAVTAFVQETARLLVPRRSQLIRQPAPPEIRRLVDAKRNRDPEATYIDQDGEYFKDQAQDRAGIADHEDATAGVVVFDDRRRG